MLIGADQISRKLNDDLERMWNLQVEKLHQLEKLLSVEKVVRVLQ